MAAFILRSLQLSTLALVLVLASPILADDVSVQLDANGGFSIKDSTGAIERLRIDEATGNISRNGTLFVHTTGTNNTFVGFNAGAGPPTPYSGNSGFGFSALRGNTGFFNSAVGYLALSAGTAGSENTAVGTFALAANTTGFENSAVGNFALAANTAGADNTAVGSYALYANTAGNLNSAFGRSALTSNTTGSDNTGIGYGALRDDSSGSYNTAVGNSSLQLNSTGTYNTAVGFIALSHNTTGHYNVAIGQRAGDFQTTGSHNIYIANGGVAGESGQIRIGAAGPQTAAFIAGIVGVTTANANAIPVLIDSAGQLGTISSSRNVKKDIRDMGDSTARLLDLRPVTFRYKQEQTLPDGGEVPPEYGLIAEEVAEIYPDLVVYDENGRPFTVKYHELAPMLLNEMKRREREHERELAALTTRVAQLEQRLAVTASAPAR